jgi:hypothetical protein
LNQVGTKKVRMAKKKRRRPGATETIGVSLDIETKRALKALADEEHQGNVSALITEMTAEAVRQAAFERAWRWYGGAEPTDTTGETRRGVRRRLEARSQALQSRLLSWANGGADGRTCVKPSACLLA